MSCRVTAPHEPPYVLKKDEDERGFEVRDQIVH